MQCGDSEGGSPSSDRGPPSDAPPSGLSSLHNVFFAAHQVAASAGQQQGTLQQSAHLFEHDLGQQQSQSSDQSVNSAGSLHHHATTAAAYGQMQQHLVQHHSGAGGAASHYLAGQQVPTAGPARSLPGLYGAAASQSDLRPGGGYGVVPDALSSQKAVAFLAGPRERIHVYGNPVECCPRCTQEGFGSVPWRPHRHIGELKIRYICERTFEDLESNHHFDIPLCPVCGQVLYLYEFGGLLGVSSARRLHKYVLKCANRHVLPLIDLFCQTKRGGERCNSNFKLQWCYDTMVKRCEAQRNRDHDLWWVRYKNEWKQRRTIIRYKKDFLRHLSDVQRALLLGLGLEGEAPPDPKTALGPTYDALVATAGGSPAGPKIKKRHADSPIGAYGAHVGLTGHDDYNDYEQAAASLKRSRDSPHSVEHHVSAQSSASAAAAAGYFDQMPQQVGSPQDAALAAAAAAAAATAHSNQGGPASGGHGGAGGLSASAFQQLLAHQAQQHLDALEQAGYGKHEVEQAASLLALDRSGLPSHESNAAPPANAF